MNQCQALHYSSQGIPPSTRTTGLCWYHSNSSPGWNKTREQGAFDCEQNEEEKRHGQPNTQYQKHSSELWLQDHSSDTQPFNSKFDSCVLLMCSILMNSTSWPMKLATHIPRSWLMSCCFHSNYVTHSFITLCIWTCISEWSGCTNTYFKGTLYIVVVQVHIPTTLITSTSMNEHCLVHMKIHANTYRQSSNLRCGFIVLIIIYHSYKLRGNSGHLGMSYMCAGSASYLLASDGGLFMQTMATPVT